MPPLGTYPGEQSQRLLRAPENPAFWRAGLLASSIWPLGALPYRDREPKNSHSVSDQGEWTPTA
jgi:hypothetical protein